MSQTGEQPSGGVTNDGVEKIQPAATGQQTKDGTGTPGCAFESIEGGAEAGIPDQTLPVVVKGHDVRRHLDVVAGRLELDRTELQISRVGSLPPLKVVAAEGVVGIDGEAKWTRVEIGIRILDIKVVLGV